MIRDERGTITAWNKDSLKKYFRGCTKFGSASILTYEDLFRVYKDPHTKLPASNLQPEPIKNAIEDLIEDAYRGFVIVTSDNNMFNTKYTFEWRADPTDSLWHRPSPVPTDSEIARLKNLLLIIFNKTVSDRLQVFKQGINFVLFDSDSSIPSYLRQKRAADALQGKRRIPMEEWPSMEFVFDNALRCAIPEYETYATDWISRWPSADGGPTNPDSDLGLQIPTDDGWGRDIIREIRKKEYLSGAAAE